MALILNVDVETSYEFLKEIYQKIKPDYLQELSKSMEEKVELFTHVLHPDNIEDENLANIYHKIFSIRRKSKKWSNNQMDQLKDFIIELLFGKEELSSRFNVFCNRLKTNFKINRPYEVAGELLAYTKPEDYSLWSNWIYNPDTAHGSILLVFNEELKISANSYGETYLEIIEIQNKLQEMAVELGISPSLDPQNSSIFDVPVFLCAVYAIYTFTVTRLRMSSEFNTILPNLEELTARLLGVYTNEINENTEQKLSVLT